MIEYATHVKSMKSVNGTSDEMNWRYSGTLRPAPRPKGIAIPAKATVTAFFAFFRMMDASISRPTKNRKRQRPMFAVSDRNGLDEDGNTCSVNPGTRPKTVGPNKMPPST